MNNQTEPTTFDADDVKTLLDYFLAPPGQRSAALITVCDKCLRACCWKGVFMCDDAYGAGTVEKTRAELATLDREHSDYWSDDDAQA